MFLGDPAREVLKDACQELMLMNRHVRSVFDKAVAEFKVKQARLASEEEKKTKSEEAEHKKQRDLLASMDIESDWFCGGNKIFCSVFFILICILYICQTTPT